MKSIRVKRRCKCNKSWPRRELGYNSIRKGDFICSLRAACYPPTRCCWKYPTLMSARLPACPPAAASMAAGVVAPALYPPPPLPRPRCVCFTFHVLLRRACGKLQNGQIFCLLQLVLFSLSFFFIVHENITDIINAGAHHPHTNAHATHTHTHVVRYICRYAASRRRLRCGRDGAGRGGATLCCTHAKLCIRQAQFKESPYGKWLKLL